MVLEALVETPLGGSSSRRVELNESIPITIDEVISDIIPSLKLRWPLKFYRPSRKESSLPTTMFQDYVSYTKCNAG